MEFKEFTKEDFLDTFTPYEYAHTFAENQVKLEIVLKNLAKQAKPFGIIGIKGLYKAYARQLLKKNIQDDLVNHADFTGCDVDYVTGEWNADDSGIARYNRYGEEEIACKHPIIITERLRNIDTGMVKLKLAFSIGNRWQDVIVNRSIVSSSNKIIELSDKDIDVNTESAKNLVRYLSDFDHINRNLIPEVKCSSRLGWIEEKVFAPYDDELKFDGDINLSNVFNSVKQVGSFDTWKDEIIECCNYNYINKIVIGAAFAAPLVKWLNTNSYFVHLWADTETAKTVSIMCAASIWADPQVGKYIQTFNSTNVGKEKFAEIANSLPVFFDELEIATDRKSFDREIYELSEGAGRLRGNKYGSTDKTGTWGTCFLTTGEKPILHENSKGGAMNRILEIHCTNKLIENGNKTVTTIKENYGHAGKIFIEKIKGMKDEIIATFQTNNKILESSLKTEKQTAIAASIVTAFQLATQIIFDNKLELTMSEITDFLRSKETMSVHGRAYEYLMDWISVNINRFYMGKATDTNGVICGKIENNICYIIKSEFDKMCDEAGYNSTAFLYWMSNNSKLAKKDKIKNTKTTRIKDSTPRCVAIFLNSDEVEERIAIEEE
jgi:uncharacterized protein (DUF927 family)